MIRAHNGADATALTGLASGPMSRRVLLALEAAGCEAAEALHVGDTPEEDVAGARAAGMKALLLDREGGGDIASLAEIPSRLESMGG